MKFQKLRLAGFKSFCEATDFVIEPGLTGVVGPNGCGKSNLVEALRWVMGENSYKSMRASGMEDVIFSGSGKRPARNVAEVGIVLDNTARTAPAAFNASDTIEVTRKIERDHGSVYRINGREARARDVQLLFADASSGARSPAMVRQGQIGEIIAARPQARRRILEEAAGVAGLHSRRHEAELRLKAAEDNLSRLEDVVKQLDAQIEGLKRQARQAQRYRALAGDIRRAEALIFHIHHAEAQAQVMQAERAMREGLAEVAERTRVQAETARLQAVAAHGLPPLRETAVACAASLQRLVLAREALDGDERRARERAQEIDRRLTQLQRDRARETALIADATAMLEKLATEAAGLARSDSQTAGQAREAEARAAKAQLAQSASDAALAKAQAALAELNAKRNAIETQLRDERQRFARFEAEAQKVAQEQAALRGSETDEARFIALGREVEEQRKTIAQLEAAGIQAERALAQTREAEGKIRPPLSEAERKTARLETELRTLEKLFSTTAAPGHWPSVLEASSVERGFEMALGAALGDDLDASANPEAPAHWSEQPGENDPALPEGATPLATRVTAPAAMHRRLAQIGIVSREDAPRLREKLSPGQRLVTREGDLWRWDGFTSAAEAPSPAARRLAEKNRLGDLKAEAQAAREATRVIFLRMEQAQAATRAATAVEAAARSIQRDAGRTLEAAREKLGAAERRRAQAVARLGALDEAAGRLEAGIAEAREKATQAEAALAALPRNDEQVRELDAARALAALDRAELAEARANVRIFAGEAEARARRAGAIAADNAGWQARLHSAGARGEELAHRETEAQAQQRQLAGAPDAFVTQRRALMGQIDSAEEQRKNANDALVLAETRMSASDRAARSALDAMAAAREDNARAQAMVEAHRLRLDELLVQIDSELECGPADLAALAGLAARAKAPDRADAERTLERLRADREKLGAVNLRAETELSRIEESKAALESERDDLQEAIKRLRTAIASLNHEGRERLQAAFEVVNGHFRALFVTLFGGGEAELQLVESDDPLEAGLEILARPPGKKPQTMTLLSGGEQALTAMALIFAVFLTNPAPICVLDEVDAPLDDANVERFCDLLEAMSQRTDTRFLTITHNPITMARMNRLFGVTMAEQGVSQLVSVDLGEAEKFLEAG